MATIRSNDSSVVLINTFFVAPERADELMQLLIEATETAMRHQPRPDREKNEGRIVKRGPKTAVQTRPEESCDVILRQPRPPVPLTFDRKQVYISCRTTKGICRHQPTCYREHWIY